MANGYLGKISAIVSANTADFDSKLSKSAAEVRKFAGSMQGTLTSAQSGSAAALRGIYTDAQKVERALKAVSTQKLSFKGFQGPDLQSAVTRMQALYSVTEQISKPLAGAAKSLGKLSYEVQGVFLPAMKSAQKATESLAATVDKTGKVGAKQFGSVASQVERTTAAVSRLKEASALVSGLASGNELRFQRPEQVSEAQRSATIQSQIGSLPPSLMAGMDGYIAQQKAAALETERLAAAIEKAKLSRKGDVARNVAAAEDAYRKQIALQSQLNTLVEQEVAARRRASAATTRSFTLQNAPPVKNDLGLFGTNVQRGADQALARARALSVEFSKLPAAASNSISGLAQIAGRMANDLQAGRTNATAFNQVLDRLEGSVRSLAAAEQSRDAASQARQRILAAEIAENDRLIDQERELAAARRADVAESRQRVSGSLADAEQALIGPRRPREQPIDEVFSGLGRQAEQFRTSVDSTFGLPQFGELSDQARRAGVEIQNIATEIRRLESLDPQHDIEEYADAWSRAYNRVRQVNDVIAGGTRIADAAAAAGNAPPPPPVPPVIDRNQDRLGASSPMDRNAGNVGARTSLGGVGASTDVFGMGRSSSLADHRRDLARSAVGPDIEAPRRQLSGLEGSITSLKSRIDTLPEPLRARFVPAIRDAEREFIRLSTAVVPVAAEIEAARRRLVVLTQDANRAAAAMNFAGSFGGEGITGINLGLDQRALQGFEGALTSLQGALGRTRAAARGPAVAAFNELRNAIAQAFAAGTTEEPATRQRLARLQAAAVNATSQAGGGSVSRIRRDMQRAGDVGRGGFDNLSLAANQAAFAIDDFMSSTGGLDQKLRAVSNNITQMAFVLGGTTGLFIGLGAVLAGQVAVGIVRFINNGRTSEDQTKALNEALARQKGLVEELAQAFRSLGDAMSRGTFSAGGDAGRQFGQSVSDIRRKQRDAREGRVAGSNVAFQQNAANLSRDKRELETQENPGIRAALANRIREAESLNRALPSVLANRAPQLPAISGTRGVGTGEITTPERLQEVLVQEALRNIPTMQNTPTGRGIITDEERERRARAMVGNAGDTFSSQREVIQTMIGQLAPQAGAYTPGGREVSQTIARLQSLLDQLETPFQRAIDEMALKVAAASEEAARSIRSSQEDVAAAISRGVSGAALFQQRLDSLASELADADAQLARSVEMAAETGDPTKREAVVKAAEEKVAAVRVKQAETEARAREMRLGRSFGGERLTQATASMEGNERFKNERAGLIAQGRASADAELVARRKVEQSAASVGDKQQQLRDARAERQKVEDAGGDTPAADAAVKKAEADLKAAQAAAQAAGQNLELAQKSSEFVAALAEATIALEAAIARIRKIGDSAMQKSESGADAAQKAYEDNPLRGGAMEARDAAESRLIEDRARVAKAQADLDNKRREVQADPRMAGIDKEIEANKQRQQDLNAKAAIGGITPKEQAELDAAAKREIELMRQREQLAQNLTAAERKQLDAINNGIAAREKELDALRQKAAQDPTFDRRKAAAEQITETSRRQADEAQQRFINNPTSQNRKDRDEADRRLRKDSKRVEGLQDSLDAKKKKMQQDPRVQAIDKELKANNERLAALAKKEATGGLTKDERQERKFLQGKNRTIRGERDSIVEQGTRPERDAIDKEQIAQNQRDRAMRGRDLGMTERERFAKDFKEGAGADINARAKEMKDQGLDPTKFLRQAVKNQMEQVAPMLQGFEEERQNALLQGPSRKALQVSDVSTSQGASELTRLLRGDDSAKDVNLAELRKQTQKFDALIEIIKQQNPGVLL